MTLPANHPFEPTRPSYSSFVLRSSAPKLSFVSGVKASHTNAKRHNATPSVGRLMSVGASHASASPEDQASTHTSSPTRPGRKLRKPKPTLPSKELKHAKVIDWEIPRKTLHSSIGFLTLYLYASHGSPHAVVVVLTVGLSIILPVDILRLRSAGFERVYERFLGFLMRESEKKTTNGVIWYILGVIFVLSVYPMDIAVVSILILSWADTAASTIGRLFGSRTPALPRRILNIPLAPRKSLAGFLAATVTGASIATGFWGWFASFNTTQNSWKAIEHSRWLSVIGFSHFAADGAGSDAAEMGSWIGLGVLGLVSGVVSGVAEALDVGTWDDNLTLPIISGGCIWGFFKLLGYFSS